MKNIWIFNHYATKPDEPATRSYDFAKEFAKKGHKATIFASAFSHYRLETKYLDSGEKCRSEIVENVRFIWIRTFPYKRNNWRRALNMASYSWRVFWIALKIKEKPDIILGSSVHPLAVISAYLVAKFKKSRFFFEVRDLWPQTLVDMGFLGNSNPLVLLMRLIEKFLYKRAERIITLLPYAGNYITSLGISKEKIIWIPNGIDTERYKGIKKYNGGNPKKFTFMYTGIHSKYANLDNILKAAQILKDEGKTNLRFVLVGDGLEKKNLLKMAKSMNLSNVEFRDMVPKNEVFKIMSEADAFISIIRDMPVLKYGISSNKLNDYLISGRPIIFCVKTKNNPVKEAGAGISILPGDPSVLAKACKQMVSFSPEQRIKMGEKGREYIKKNYDLRILADKLEKVI